MRYLVTTLLMLGPRLAILIWCIDPPRIILGFQRWPTPAHFALSQLIWPLVGAVFAPWATWVYLMVVAGGVTPMEWLACGIGLLIDVSLHTANFYPRLEAKAWRLRGGPGRTAEL